MSESLVPCYKIDPNGLPNILNSSQKTCNLCKAIKAPDSRGILLNRRGKKYDSVISNSSTDKDTKSAHNQLIKLTPTPHKIPTLASRHNYMTLVHPAHRDSPDNRLNYRRKYDPEIFGRNQLDRIILPPLQL